MIPVEFTWAELAAVEEALAYRISALALDPTSKDEDIAPYSAALKRIYTAPEAAYNDPVDTLQPTPAKEAP